MRDGSLMRTTTINARAVAVTAPRKQMPLRYYRRCPPALFNTPCWIEGPSDDPLLRAQMRAQEALLKYMANMLEAGREPRVLN